ncbi:MAG: aminodeoxychorismate synthase component I, partial [Aeromonas sp.]
MTPALHIHHFDHHLALHQQFAPLAHLPWAMLLESAGPIGADNQFDIICADPLATLETRGLITTVCQQGHTRLHHDDPFTLLASTQQSLLGSLS